MKFAYLDPYEKTGFGYMIWIVLSIFVHEMGGNLKLKLFGNNGSKYPNLLKYIGYLQKHLRIFVDLESFSGATEIFSSNFCIRNYGVDHRVD